jgi:hypothetical protein
MYTQKYTIYSMHTNILARAPAALQESLPTYSTVYCTQSTLTDSERLTSALGLGARIVEFMMTDDGVDDSFPLGFGLS